ncbi:MAG: thiol-activated cytolysin family protein [Flavobacteriaceae bacterium]
MKTTSKLLSRFFMLLLCILVVACSKDDSDGTTDPVDTDADGIIDANDDCPNEAGTASNNGCPEALSIAQVVALGENFEDVPQTPQETTLNEEEPFDDDFDREDEGEEPTTERFICTKRTVSIEDGSEDFFLFDPNSSVIYPGNLIQGKTIDDATPESIPLLRGGGVISYNIIDGNLNASEPVETISLSAVRDAQNAIIAGATGAVPASFNLSVESVQSRRELALKLGVKFETFNAKLSGQFELNTSNQSNYVVVKLTQRFYTMDVDEPTSSDAFFDPSVTAEELAQYIQPNNPAAYISSVTYGRVFYMLFESTSSTSEMMSKLDLGYSTLGSSASGSVDYNAFNSLQELKLQVIAYGGNAEETLEAVGNFTTNQSIGDFVANLGKSGDIETGLPLSYVLKSVKRRSDIVGTNLSTEFDVVDCELKGVVPPLLYADLDGLFEDGIGAMLNISESHVLIFNKAGDTYAWYNGELPGVYKSGTGEDAQPVFFAVNENNTELPLGPLGNVPVGSVGAAVDFSPNVVYLFNNTGNLCNIATVNPANIPNTTLPSEVVVTYSVNGGADPGEDPTIFNVFDIFSSNSPGSAIFQLTNGIGAGLRLGGETMAFFNREDDTFQQYFTENNGQFEEPVASVLWLTNDNEGGSLFPNVGAGTRFNPGGGGLRYLFVNEEGTEIIEWISQGASNGQNDLFQGPWVITKN